MSQHEVILATHQKKLTHVLPNRSHSQKWTQTDSTRYFSNSPLCCLLTSHLLAAYFLQVISVIPVSFHMHLYTLLLGTGSIKLFCILFHFKTQTTHTVYCICMKWSTCNIYLYKAENKLVFF